MTALLYTTTWAVSSGLSGTCLSLAWAGTQWVAGGTFISRNPIYNSLDGKAWTPSTNGNTVLSQCNAIAARRVLPNVGTIQGQPYYIGNPTNWPFAGTGPRAPYSIPTALDLIASYLRQTGGVNWPT